MSLAKANERFTYQDYQTWPVDERWEILDGRAYDMPPAPSFKHQRIVGSIYHILRNLLTGSRCLTGIAPTDVVLSDHDVVQPDVFIVCDQSRITDKNVQCPPDVIFEVISPSTARKDRWEKRGVYERSGVREYVLIDPDGAFVERYSLEGVGRFDRGEVFSDQEVLDLRAIEGVRIPLWEVFEVPRKVDN